MGDVRGDNNLGSDNVAPEHLVRRRSSSTGDLTVCSKLLDGPAGIFRLTTDSIKPLGFQKSQSITSLMSITSDSGIAEEQRPTEEPWSPIIRWSNFLQRFLPATEIRQNASQEDIDTIEMRFQSLLVSATTNYDLDEQLKVDFSCPHEIGSQMSELLPREGYFWNIKLHLKRSRNLPNTNAKGRIDPYIKIKYRGKTIRRTRIIFNNRNPVWDETIYVPINNLEYPLELRIYNRDVFKKDDYVGRVMFPLRGLMFAMQQEFNVQLEDETGRSVKPYFGELNFSITLNEIPEANVSSDRRQFLLKQLKTDRQTVHHLPRIVPNPDGSSVRPKIPFKDCRCLPLRAKTPVPGGA